MTEPVTDLHDLLDRATDRLAAPGGAATALATARRRRRTHRAVAASTAAVVVVAGIAFAGRLGDGAPPEPEPAPPVEAIEPVPFDPSTAGALPAAPDDVAPLLPDLLRVPDLAPRIEDDPLDRAVLAVDDGADILLLGEDGRWHCVVVPGRTPADPALSDDGTRLAVGVVDGADDEVLVVDLATGARTTRLGFPPSGTGWTIDDPVVRRSPGWTVTPLAQLADRTALLQVAPGPRQGEGWWLVHWDPAADAWTLVSRVLADPGKAVSLPDDLLGGS